MLLWCVQCLLRPVGCCVLVERVVGSAVQASALHLITFRAAFTRLGFGCWGPITAGIRAGVWAERHFQSQPGT